MWKLPTLNRTEPCETPTFETKKASRKKRKKVSRKASQTYRKAERTAKHKSGHNYHSSGKLNMREVILLDSQSTMDIFCNDKFVDEVKESEQTLTLHSNGGKLESNQVATIQGLSNIAWFNRNAVTNILSLKNVGKKYRVTYDSRDATFVVHRSKHGLPDMHFKMHKSGLHVYHPKGEGKFCVPRNCSPEH